MENNDNVSLPENTEKNKKANPAPKERIHQENATIMALVLSIIALWVVKWSLIINLITVAFIVYKFFM